MDFYSASSMFHINHKHHIVQNRVHNRPDFRIGIKAGSEADQGASKRIHATEKKNSINFQSIAVLFHLKLRKAQ